MNITRYFPWIAASEAVGILSAIFSREGMWIYRETVEKPPLSPPAFLFPVVWTILYALMGIGAARVYEADHRPVRNRALNVFAAQLVVNFFWSLIFFSAQAFGFALIWLLLLWSMIAFMIILFWKADNPAALLQIPYLVWVSFAAYLNYGVWQLNK